MLDSIQNNTTGTTPMNTALFYYLFIGLLATVLAIWLFIALRDDEPRKPE